MSPEVPARLAQANDALEGRATGEDLAAPAAPAGRSRRACARLCRLSFVRTRLT